MKKILALLIAAFTVFSCVLPVFAEGGKVTYSGDAKKFFFEPGSTLSLTDLFPNFKGVMPGDTLTQQITVKNDTANNVKVKIYIRSLGASGGSEEFLSELGLKVKTSKENEMAYMFDAAANESAQLTDWVCLGTLYSGGEVNLDVILSVPTSLSNEFQDQVGYIDWEFKVEEFPIDPDDPKPPQTGDDSRAGLYFLLAICCIFMIIVLLVWRKKDRKDEECAK